MMKKIQINQPVNNAIDPIQQPKEKAKPFERKVIPQISFNKSKLAGLDDKMQKMKICNYQSDFLDQIEQVLSLYSEDELKYNDKLILFVMEEVEKFILKPKAGNAKKQLVIEACKKYFNDDADLVIMVINLVFKKLSQIKYFKRHSNLI